MRILLLVFTLLFSSTLLAEEYYPLDEAEKHLSQGNPVAAYDILAPLESQFTGDPRFDFLYGIAAVQSGHANLAILPLMRVVLTQPNNLVARYYLARAYLEVNDLQQAEYEYQLLLSMGAQGVIRQRAEADLERITAMRSKDGRETVEATVMFGFDSNANSATTETSFLGYILAENSQQTASVVMAGALNWDYRQHSRKSGALNTGVIFRQEFYPQASFVNNTSFTLYGSWRPGRKKNSEGRHNFDGFYQVVYLDGRHNTTGTYLTYMNRGLGSRSAFTYYVRYGQQIYTPDYSIQDIDQLNLGIQKKRHKDKRRVTSTSMILGMDVAREAGSPYSKVYAGLRYNRERYGKQLLSYSSFGYLLSDYEGLFLGLPRTDHQLDIRFGLVSRAYGNWRPVIELRIIDTTSSVVLYDFTRYSLTVTMKHRK